MALPFQPLLADAQLNLDIEALRHLVTRSDLASALWKGDNRKILENALCKVHGPAADDAISLISRQVLLSALQSLISKFQSRHHGAHLDPIDAEEVEKLICLVIDLHLGEKYFDAPMQMCLLSAFFHAAMATLLRDDGHLIEHYRRIVDIVRSNFTSEDSHVINLRKNGIYRIKDITTLLFESSGRLRRDSGRQSAVKKSEDFCRQRPARLVFESLQEQKIRVSQGLPIFWIHSMYNDEQSRRRRVRHPKSRLPVGNEIAVGNGAVPHFFSDAEGSEIQDAEDNEVEDEEMPNPDQTEDEPLVERSREHSHSSGRGSSRTKRRSTEPQHRRRGSRNSRNLRKRNICPGGYRESDVESSQVDEAVLQRMDSQGFQGSGEEGSAFEVVARHARARLPSNKLRRRVGQSEDGEQRAQKTPPLHEIRSDEEHGDDRNSEPNGDDRSNLRGAGSRTVRDLHQVTNALGNSNVPDPLPAAQQDARQARRRRRGSMLLDYNPAANARVASPIPETPMKRKRRNRLALRGASSSPEYIPTKRTPDFHGKYFRTGRFRPYEDDLLIQGLRKYGWGAWSSIARDFGDGNFCRAPISLKDRARTMELDSSRYPAPPSAVNKGGRPRKQIRLTPEETNDPDDDEIDEMEAPGLSAGGKSPTTGKKGPS